MSQTRASCFWMNVWPPKVMPWCNSVSLHAWSDGQLCLNVCRPVGATRRRQAQKFGPHLKEHPAHPNWFSYRGASFRSVCTYDLLDLTNLYRTECELAKDRPQFSIFLECELKLHETWLWSDWPCFAGPTLYFCYGSCMWRGKSFGLHAVPVLQFRGPLRQRGIQQQV